MLAARACSTFTLARGIMGAPALIHPITGQVNVAQLAAEITAIRDRAFDEKLRLQADFPALNPANDVRITCFSKFQNVLGSLQLGCGFWGLNLLSTDWWNRNTSYPEPDRPILRNEFQMFLKLALVQFLFSAVESSLRVFMRAIDAGAHAGASVEFKRVYDDLLLKRLVTPTPGHVELLDTVARIRNTIHNNGVYFHKSGRDAHQAYRGQTYKFIHGKPVEVGGWPLLLSIADDLLSLMRDVVRDPSIAGIAGNIVDPGS